MLPSCYWLCALPYRNSLNYSGLKEMNEMDIGWWAFKEINEMDTRFKSKNLLGQ
jgi:hypothetical protein